MDKITNETVKTPHQTKLTAPEISNLWTQYQNDSMAICIYNHMIKYVEDESILIILKSALKIAEGHITVIESYLKEEKFPIPQGFTENDLNLTAPRLFSDTICLNYTYIMSVNGLAGYAAAITTNVRRDIRDYYTQCQNQTMELFNKSLDLLLEKGIVSRPPSISPPTSIEFIEKKAFVKGFLGSERPLSCIEISHIFWDLKKIQLSRAVSMAFAQVAQADKVKKFLWRGSEMYKKHIEIFESILAMEDLPTPKSDDAEISNSTTSPFSDRLMMFHKLLFGSTTIGFYGTAIGTCQRGDLSIHYS
ncbi:DUF3231 family protein [Salipaludibacillus sp. CF4.18]|uniref:DUF3231 family protein n=1 Tax=Salipaludibacillus sp. CF4.18 TaxID=3373081 RepID=UPI003EE439FB